MSSVLFSINLSFYFFVLPLSKWEILQKFHVIDTLYLSMELPIIYKKLKTTNNDMLLWTFCRKFIYSTFWKQENLLTIALLIFIYFFFLTTCLPIHSIISLCRSLIMQKYYKLCKIGFRMIQMSQTVLLNFHELMARWNSIR